MNNLTYFYRKFSLPFLGCYTGLTARLGPFLTRVLRDDNNLELFVCHEWRRVIGVQKVVYKDLCCEFFSTIHCDKYSMRWADRSVFSFRIGCVSRSCSLIELGMHLGIYTSEGTLSPHFYAYLDNCIIEPPKECN